MKKQILNKIAKLDNENQKLFDEKANLEEKILLIDIKLHKIIREYNTLCKRLFNK